MDGTLRCMDRIVSIDNNDVTQENIHSVLDKVGNKSHLSFEVMKEQYNALTSSKQELEDPPGDIGIGDNHLRFIAGKESFENIAESSDKKIGTYLCMYMTLNDKEQAGREQGMEDLVFYYPHQPIPKDIDSKDPAASGLHKLIAVRGMFYTLADVIQTMSGLAGDRATLKMTNGEIVHVAFKLLPNKEILVIAAPNDVVVKKKVLCGHLDRFLDVLSFEFGNASNAFMQQSNWEELDQLCGLLFSCIYRSYLFDPSDVFISNLMGSQSLRVHSDINTDLVR